MFESFFRAFFTIASLLLIPLCTLADGRGIAVVIDRQSLNEARAELNEYINAIEQVQNLHVYTVVDRWGVPDSIRKELQRLYSLKQNPIIGAVLIGDIPIVMVRDAQYLCSAFKMSQKFAWPESSVPSDRYYDDFGLAFSFLKKDSVAPYFYYSLTAEGDQTLKPDIFSGRIRPTDAGGTSRYEKLRAYLRKATQQKRNPEALTSVFVYTGSGSLTESKVAHIDEMNSMHEHLPSLENVPGAFSYMDYSEAPYIKKRLMNEMMRPDLSIGLMHHHGDYDTQYLSDYPKPRGVQEAKQYMLYSYAARILRGVRFGENIDSLKQSIAQRDGVPQAWLDSITLTQAKDIDSTTKSRINLTLPDFERYSYRPNCRLVIYDACYNGSFHKEDCIANEYIFQPGRTIVGIGGSVNVLQDKWPDRNLGLMADGMMAGYLNMYNLDLEMHVVGDPTFFFVPAKTSTVKAITGSDVNELLSCGTDKQWLKLLNSATASSDAKAMAIRKLSSRNALPTSRLVETLKSSPFGVVRMESYMALREKGYTNEFADVLKQAANDNFELLQRFAMNDIIKSGDPRLIGTFARLLTQNNTSARVAFNAMQGVQFFQKDELLKAVDSALDSLCRYVINPEEYRAERMHEINKYAGRWVEDIDNLCSNSLTPRRALLQADYMRIYLPSFMADKVAQYTETVEDPQLQIQLLHALGWHRMCYKVNAIAEMAQRLVNNPSLAQEVRDEALRTLKRLK